MANDRERIVLMSLDGSPSIMVPSATSWKLYSCGEEGCGNVHVVSLDAQDMPICETTFSREQLLRLANQMTKS
jgi:hypothetical protein